MPRGRNPIPPDLVHLHIHRLRLGPVRVIPHTVIRDRNLQFLDQDLLGRGQGLHSLEKSFHHFLEELNRLFHEKEGLVKGIEVYI